MKSEEKIIKQLELQEEFLKEAISTGDGEDIAREQGAVNVLKWVLNSEHKDE